MDSSILGFTWYRFPLGLNVFLALPHLVCPYPIIPLNSFLANPNRDRVIVIVSSFNANPKEKTNIKKGLYMQFFVRIGWNFSVYFLVTLIICVLRIVEDAYIFVVGVVVSLTLSYHRLRTFFNSFKCSYITEFKNVYFIWIEQFLWL